MYVPDADDQLSNLIHNVTVLRQRHGLSRKEMAKILHISPYLLRMLESGRISSRLYVDFLFYLRDYFQLSSHDIFHMRM